MGLASLSVGGFVIHSSFACHAVASSRAAAPPRRDICPFVIPSAISRYARHQHDQKPKQMLKKMLTLLHHLT
jgi:hypothetical protein